eukprot:Opistho-1_new@94181
MLWVYSFAAASACAAAWRSVTSTNVTTTPSTRLSAVRYGVARRWKCRPSAPATARSVVARRSSTARQSASRAGSSNLRARAEIGRPMSPGIRSIRSRAAGVNRRMRKLVSRNRTAMSVLASRLVRSLLAAWCSSILPRSWALTVVNSSLSDCISSLLVSNSSFALWSSSLTLVTSSLDAFSSSLDVCSSSMVPCSSPRSRRTSASRPSAASGGPPPPGAGTSPWSTKLTTKYAAGRFPAAGSATGEAVTPTRCRRPDSRSTHPSGAVARTSSAAARRRAARTAPRTPSRVRSSNSRVGSPVICRNEPTSPPCTLR